MSIKHQEKEIKKRFPWYRAKKKPTTEGETEVKEKVEVAAVEKTVVEKEVQTDKAAAPKKEVRGEGETCS